MNPKFLFLSPLVLLMFSCSDNSPEDGSLDSNASSSQVTVSTNYISLNIVSPGAASGRAGSDFIDGTDEENNIKMVRLFFFDDKGNGVPVTKDPTDESAFLSYIDLSPSQLNEEGNDQNNTIEKIVSTTIALEQPETAAKPSFVLAIVNPSSAILGLDEPSFDQLEYLTEDYINGHTDSNFVMSNTSYRDASGNKYKLQEITKENLASSAADARKEGNQLVIYVERAAARLDLSFDSSSNTVNPVDGKDHTYNLGFTFAPEDDTDINIPVYVKFLGWNIVSTPVHSHLVKEINHLWDDKIFANEGTQPWNSSDFHRSFWALNPENLDEKDAQTNIPLHYDWFSYTELTSADAKGYPLSNSTVYTHENAEPYSNADLLGKSPSYPSKVIMAAQLVDANDKPVTICEYLTQYFTLDGLKTVVANNLSMFTPTGNNQYDKILPEQINFITAKKYSGEDGPDTNGTYFIYFSLTDEASKLDWYHQASSGTGDSYSKIENIERYMYNAAGRAMIWNQGRTYYFFDILHLGNSGKTGEKGVIRNHIYDSRIVDISGLGTPVYDPDQKIYPEVPDRSGNMISAKINVLQWRVVSKDFKFSW